MKVQNRNEPIKAVQVEILKILKVQPATQSTIYKNDFRTNFWEFLPAQGWWYKTAVGRSR